MRPFRFIPLLLPALVAFACARAPLPAEKGEDKPEAKADARAKAADAPKAEGGAKADGKPAAGAATESLGRNMVNLIDKGITTDFAVKPKGKERNDKWSAALGTVSYGGPVIAGGKVYVGTNNA